MLFFVKFLSLYAILATSQAVILHIPNGTEAEPHTHPWMVSVKLRNGSHWCGASLLKSPCLTNESDIVLTAAHCLPCDDHSAGVLFSRFFKAGEHSLRGNDDGEQKREMTAFKCHEQWPTTKPPNVTTCHKANDIAVIKLKEPIKFSNTIKAIDLPEFNSRIPEDAYCFFAGWGNTTNGPPDVLQELDVNPHSEYCKKDMLYNDTGMICVERKFEGVGSGCGGDSGSPLVCKYGNHYVQEGIVSGPPFTEKGMACQAAGIFVRVSRQVKWIEETIKSLGECEN